MDYKLLEQVIKGSELQVHSTRVLEHFLYIELDNCNVLLFQSKMKYEVDYVVLYSISKDGQYAGSISTPELNMIVELRRLSELDSDDVDELVVYNKEV